MRPTLLIDCSSQVAGITNQYSFCKKVVDQFRKLLLYPTELRGRAEISF